MRRFHSIVVIGSLVGSLPAFALPRIERLGGHDVAAQEIIIEFKSSAASAALGALAQLTDSAKSDRLSRSAPVFRLRSRSKNVQALLNILKNRPEIEYAEPNYIVRAGAAPNDTNFSDLWGLSNTGQPILGATGTAGADIGAQAAWNITTGSAANVVAVLDTGIDYNHPDLVPNLWSAPSDFTVNVNGVLINCPAGSHGYNAFTQNCDPMDDSYHGTHVSGTIGAAGNNSSGVAGVNWSTRIMALKFLDSSALGTTADAVTAIDFAIQVKNQFGAAANVRVLSASWGGSGYSQALTDAISRANDADMLFVAAAGNGAANNDLNPTYPANVPLPNVLSVAATDNLDALAGFSNYGAATVHLAAPGVSVLSTVPGGGYSWASGTSMATPHVSGAAMLVLSACALDTTALRTLLLSTVDPVPALAGKTVSGGRLDVGRALETCAPPVVTIQNAATFITTDLATQGTWKSSYGSDGYTIQADGAHLPAYAQLSTASASRWTWAASTTDVRALQKAAAGDRIASTWYSSAAFSYDVNLTDGNAHKVALYAVDWDRRNRSERIDILDGATGTVLDSRALSVFANGAYVVWSLKGHVVIRVTCTGPSNAVVSGIFFGDSGIVSQPPPEPSTTAAFLRVDTTTQGGWKGAYGGGGYQIQGAARLYPAYAVVSTNAPATWTWTGSTSDVRALQKPNAADRIASCWYGSTYYFDINLIDGNTHQVAMYVLDWDRKNRSERIEVLDAATGTVLDTRSVSAFSGGQYLVWNIAGHVRIRMTLLSGANAVVSGVFID